MARQLPHHRARHALAVGTRLRRLPVVAVSTFAVSPATQQADRRCRGATSSIPLLHASLSQEAQAQPTCQTCRYAQRVCTSTWVPSYGVPLLGAISVVGAQALAAPRAVHGLLHPTRGPQASSSHPRPVLAVPWLSKLTSLQPHREREQCRSQHLHTHYKAGGCGRTCRHLGSLNHLREAPPAPPRVCSSGTSMPAPTVSQGRFRLRAMPFRVCQGI